MTNKKTLGSVAALRVRFLCLACACGLPLLVGCPSSGSGKLLPAEGKVTLNNKPLGSGTVTFVPADGKAALSTGNPTGEIQSDGSYKLTTGGKPGAPAGKYKVTVTPTPGKTGEAGDPTKMAGGGPKGGPGTGAAPITGTIPTKYDNPASSDLTIEVTSSTKDYPLNLTGK
jgi:hypothetical protein